MWLKRLDNSAEVPQLMSGYVEIGKPILQTPHSRTLVLYVSITTWSPLSMLLPTPISSQGQVHSCFRPSKTEITVRKFSQMYTLIIFYNLYNLCNIKKKCFFSSFYICFFWNQFLCFYHLSTPYTVQNVFMIFKILLNPQVKVAASFPVSLKQYDSEAKETTHKRDKNLFQFIFLHLPPLKYFLIPLWEECLCIFPSFITLAVSHLFAGFSCYHFLLAFFVYLKSRVKSFLFL